MKKSKKWLLIGLGGFVLLIFLIGNTPDSEKTDIESSKENKVSQEQQVDSQEKENADEEKEEGVEEASLEEESKEEETEEVEKTRFAVLSGEDPETGDVILDINIWEEAGSGGQNNVAIGNIPHNTEVEVLESKEVEGYVFYKIRSSVGRVSVLPTEWEARVRAIQERPQEEWYVPADPSFPVEGWVLENFIVN